VKASELRAGDVVRCYIRDGEAPWTIVRVLERLEHQVRIDFTFGEDFMGRGALIDLRVLDSSRLELADEEDWLLVEISGGMHEP
jgi:hypothetical protein